MKDKIFKIKLLILRILRDISYEYIEWKENVYSRDLDWMDCCDGRECGCEGRTLRENLEVEIKDY